MKILFVCQGWQSFVQKDFDVLREAYPTRGIQFRGVRDLPSVWRGVLWSDLTFSWFGKLHAFFAVFFSKMLGKRAIVVAGGDEVACEPEINYGMFACWWKTWCPLFIFRRADLVLSVSKFNRRETIENAKADPSKVRLLYHGFNDQKWQRVDAVRKENLVLTVARVTDETFRKKGLEMFVQSAGYLPDVPFVLVGPWPDGAIGRLRAMAPSNVTFTGGLYGEDLIQMYSRAKVYAQVSVHESFGCSVAESMLCECVPVVSPRAALPEVVGNCGFYVDELTPEAVAAQIERALVSDLGHRARKRIVREFPLEKRQEALLAVVDEVMTK